MDQILPQIQLKFFKHSGPDDQKQKIPQECFMCHRKEANIGAMTNQGIVCEDCVVDTFAKDFGIADKKIAAARRRRIFDVGYLFTEMYIETVLQKRGKSSFDDISDMKELNRLIEDSKSAYNAFFTREEKLKLEETWNQKEIEERLHGTVQRLVK